MPEQIHGHEVMQMMIASDRSFTRETLRQAIIEDFGQDARFYTCARQDMSVDQLIDFLNMRDKFVDKGDGFSTSADKMCSH